MPPTHRPFHRPRLALLLLTGLSLGFVPAASMGLEVLEADCKVELQDAQELISEPRIELSHRRERTILKHPLRKHSLRRTYTTNLPAHSGLRTNLGNLVPLRL